MTFYDNRFFDSKDFYCSILPFDLPHNERIELHHHLFVEFVWVISGSGEHLYQGYSSPIKAGDVFVIEPNEEHGYHVTGEALKGYNLLFQPSLLSAEFAMLSNVSSFVDFFYVEPFLRQSHHFIKHLRLKPHEQVEMKLLFDRLESEFTQRDEVYRIVIKTYLIQMFVFLSRCYQQRRQKPLVSFANDQDIINRVCDFISLHYTKPLTLEQVSQICAMSPSTFKTKFKHYTGKTFLEFRNTMRLKTARELLTETDEKIVAIAEHVGFADLSFFNRSFKQAYRVSPGEYRRQMRRA